MNQMKWIPTTERLPEESGEYLVTLNMSEKHEREVDTMPFSRKYNKWNVKDRNTKLDAEMWGWDATDPYVLAWMPLPEPYDGEI